MRSRLDWIYLFHCILILVFPWVLGFMLPGVEKRFGEWADTAVGLLALGGFLFYLRWLWRLFDRMQQQELVRIRVQHPGIYRVLGNPTDTSRFRWFDEVKVRVGDYGWEAPPPKKNGLIYLEGLSDDWGLVWLAGFHPSQVEYVCEKPVSQYDWRDFEYAGSKPVAHYALTADYKPTIPCPYPVPAPKGLKTIFPRPF